MPDIEGVIITVPNEQHFSIKQIAEAGKHVYTEKPISNILADGLRMEMLQKTQYNNDCWP